MNFLNRLFSHLASYSVFLFSCLSIDGCASYSGGIDGNSFCVDGLFVSCRDKAIKWNKENCKMKQDDVYQILNNKDIREKMLWCYRKSIQNCHDDSTTDQQSCYPSEDYTIVVKIPYEIEVISIQGGNDVFKQCASEEIRNFNFRCYGYGTNEKFTKGWHFDGSIVEAYEAAGKREFINSRKTRVIGAHGYVSTACQSELIDSVFRQHEDDIYDCYLRGARNSRYVYGEMRIKVSLDASENIYVFLPSEYSSADEMYSYFPIKNTDGDTSTSFTDEVTSCIREKMSQWDFGTGGTVCSFESSWELPETDSANGEP